MKHSFLTIATIAAISILPFAKASHAETTLAEMPAGIYKIDKTHASVTWKVSHLGLSNYTARFADIDATIDLNPTDPEKSTVTATINPASVKTDYPYPDKKDFDQKLASHEEWFNADKFPKITFTSTHLEKTSETTGKLTGDLTFLGVTKPVTLDVTLNGVMEQQPFSQKPAIGFSATGTIKRSEWGLTTYVPNIGDDVQIIIEAEFAGKTVLN